MNEWAKELKSLQNKDNYLKLRFSFGTEINRFLNHFLGDRIPIIFFFFSHGQIFQGLMTC